MNTMKGFLLYEKMREYLVNAVPHDIAPDPFQIYPFLQFTPKDTVHINNENWRGRILYV
jgi:hypothetical protein